jgi:hypothetical protein
VNVVKDFLAKHEASITGTISVFDRLIFKGYLPMTYPESAEKFFAQRGILLKDFRDFTKTQTEKLKAHAQQMAKNANRPYEYLSEHVRKEEYVRKIAERDGITEGLICVLALNEENHTFSLRYGVGRPRLKKSSPRCLTLYFYYLDRHFGFMHIRLSTWLPFSIQVYVNGHDWLARQMAAKDIPFKQVENAFIRIEDCSKAQTIADRLPTLRWEAIMHVFAKRVNPLLKTILSGMEYYWVIDQAEYATDIMFKNHAVLEELYLNWQKHAAVCTQAEDVMRFMGRKLHGSFNSVIQTDAKYRPTVTRIKHVMRGNWIKMYNKQGIVLRVETVLNRPQEFRVFRLSRGKRAGYFQPLRKRVTNMIHYAFVCLRANKAYLNALSAVDDPTAAFRELDRICEPAKKGNARYRPLNPLRQNDRLLFEAVIRGEHHLHGFKACEIAKLLGIILVSDPRKRKRQAAFISRKLRLLRAHGLIARCGKSRRYRTTEMGVRHMNAAIALHSDTLPQLLKMAA